MINDRPYATFAVPVLDRQHTTLAPHIVALKELRSQSPSAARFEIRQLPNADAVPVLWHAIEFK